MAVAPCRGEAKSALVTTEATRVASLFCDLGSQKYGLCWCARPGYDLVPGFRYLGSLPAGAPERAGGCLEALTSGPGDDSVIAGMPRIWSHLLFTFACPLSQAGSPIKMCLVRQARHLGTSVGRDPPEPGPTWAGCNSLTRCVLRRPRTERRISGWLRPATPGGSGGSASGGRREAPVPQANLTCPTPAVPGLAQDFLWAAVMNGVTCSGPGAVEDHAGGSVLGRAACKLGLPSCDVSKNP